MRRIALERHVVTRRELVALGLSSAAVARWVERGRLVPLHRGVYILGGMRPSREQRWAAAVSACGRGAALSHLSAAALWGLREVDPAVIDVSVRGRGARRRDRVRLHRPRILPATALTTRRGIPVTSVDRTLLDCASVLEPRSLERMLDEAEYLGLLDRDGLLDALARLNGRRGAARLRRVLARHEPGTTRTRNKLEEAFLRLIRGAGFPNPAVNAKLGPYEIDFLWRDDRVAAETDGRQSHERASARERDYRRDAWLNANGYRPLRFTWAQVHHRPSEVLAALEAALVSRQASGRSAPPAR